VGIFVFGVIHINVKYDVLYNIVYVFLLHQEFGNFTTNQVRKVGSIKMSGIWICAFITMEAEP
jgi:hypothetical protein